MAPLENTNPDFYTNSLKLLRVISLSLKAFTKRLVTLKKQKKLFLVPLTVKDDFRSRRVFSESKSVNKKHFFAILCKCVKKKKKTPNLFLDYKCVEICECVDKSINMH